MKLKAYKISELQAGPARMTRIYVALKLDEPIATKKFQFDGAGRSHRESFPWIKTNRRDHLEVDMPE